MAIVKETIKAGIKSAFTQVMDDQGDRQQALDRVADTLAGAVVDALKSITITYTTGLTSATGGPVTGVFNCTIQ